MTTKKVDAMVRARIRELTRPPLSDTEAAKRGIKVDRDGLVRCRVCGCTEREPCFPPCAWAPDEPDICDRCHHAAFVLRCWFAGAHRASWAALLREVARMKAREEAVMGSPKVRKARRTGGRP